MDDLGSRRSSQFISKLPNNVETKLAVSGGIISFLVFLWAFMCLLPVMINELTIVNDDDGLNEGRRLYFLGKNAMTNLYTTYSPMVVLCFAEGCRRRLISVLKGCCCCTGFKRTASAGYVPGAVS